MAASDAPVGSANACCYGVCLPRLSGNRRKVAVAISPQSASAGVAVRHQPPSDGAVVLWPRDKKTSPIERLDVVGILTRICRNGTANLGAERYFSICFRYNKAAPAKNSAALGDIVCQGSGTPADGVSGGSCFFAGRQRSTHRVTAGGRPVTSQSECTPASQKKGGSQSGWRSLDIGHWQYDIEQAHEPPIVEHFRTRKES